MASTSISLTASPATVELANWRDLNALRHIEQVCFPKDAWPLWDLIGVLTLPNVVRLKAVDGGRMIGFIAGDIRPHERLAWIATLGVLPEYRRRGIGSALLQACEARLTMPTVRLCVRASNQEAIDLYSGSGYQKISLWPNYYFDSEDAIVMEKSLQHAYR